MTESEIISGLCNLRGVPGTRDGLIMRCDVPLWLTPDQVAALGPPGVQIDLRATKEAAEDGPGALEAAGWIRRHVPYGEVGPRPDLEVPDFTDRENAYRYVTAMGVGAVAESFEIIASSPGPVLFHCTAGKDRTGVLAISIGLALGVADELAIAEYVKSAENLAEIDRRFLTLPSVRSRNNPVTPSAFPVTAEMGRKVLETIAAAGGIDAWLASAGAAPDLTDRLRARLA